MQKPGFLLITNAIRPYHRHNISILSLPPGGRYHFRYQKQYVSEKLPADISQCPGLLVIRNKQTGEMLPLRWCSGIRKEDYGDYLFFDFQFESVFDFRTLNTGTLWKTYTSQLEALLPTDIKNIPGKDLAPLVFPVSSGALGKLHRSIPNPSQDVTISDHVARWLSVVSLLGSLDAYKNEHFYTVSRLYQDGGSGNGEYRCRNLSTNRSGYKLVGHRVYFLEVIQVSVPIDSAKAPVEEFRLRLPAGHIQELRTAWTIDGPYDRARFLFYVVPQESARVPSLLILTKGPSTEKQVERTPEAQAATAVEAVVGPDVMLGPPVPPTLLDLEIVWGARRYFGKRILPGLALVAGVLLFFGADWVATLVTCPHSPRTESYDTRIA